MAVYEGADGSMANKTRTKRVDKSLTLDQLPLNEYGFVIPWTDLKKESDQKLVTVFPFPFGTATMKVVRTEQGVVTE